MLRCICMRMLSLPSCIEQVLRRGVISTLDREHFPRRVGDGDVGSSTLMTIDQLIGRSTHKSNLESSRETVSFTFCGIRSMSSIQNTYQRPCAETHFKMTTIQHYSVYLFDILASSRVSNKVQ